MKTMLQEPEEGEDMAGVPNKYTRDWKDEEAYGGPGWKRGQRGEGAGWYGTRKCNRGAGKRGQGCASKKYRKRNILIFPVGVAAPIEHSSEVAAYSKRSSENFTKRPGPPKDSGESGANTRGGRGTGDQRGRGRGRGGDRGVGREDRNDGNNRSNVPSNRGGNRGTPRNPGSSVNNRLARPPKAAERKVDISDDMIKVTIADRKSTVTWKGEGR